MSRALLFVPVFGFLLLAVVSLVGMYTIDTQKIPSVMIDKPVPDFDLPAISEKQPGFASKDLLGEVYMINVFGSWCVACQYEHNFLMNLKANNVIPIYGIDWREPTDVSGQAWLDRYGNPYTAVGDDRNGDVVIQFGVTGAPETFIIDRDGRIRLKQIGPITQQVWDKTMWPMIEKLRAEPSRQIAPAS